jgi:WD40 repeat protein
MGITVNYILNKIIKYIIIYYMRYNINYSQKGGSSFINRTQIYNISNDLIVNIIKYIDFKKCKDLIKILENTNELKKKIIYKNLNKYKQFDLELPTNYKNKLCDKLNEKKKNECLRYVYNCHNKYKLLKTYDIPIDLYEGFQSVDINYDNTMIVAPTTEYNGTGYINILSVNTGKILKRLQAHKTSLKSVNFNHDGTKLVSGGTIKIGYPSKHVVCILDLITNKDYILNDHHTDNILSVGFNHDGTKIVSGSRDETIKIWNLDVKSDNYKYGESIFTLEGHTNYVNSVEFNNDGTKIVSGSLDGTIRVWNVDTGECILILEDHTDGVWSVGFNHDGTKILSGSRDETIRVWNVNEKSDKYGKCILKLEVDSMVNSVGFNNDGTKIVAGLYTKKIRVWDVKGILIQIIEFEEGSIISSVKFNKDGTKIIASSYNKKIKLFGLE